MVQICKTQAFQKQNPANFELHEGVHDAIEVKHISNYILWFTFTFMEVYQIKLVIFIPDRHRGVVYHQKGVASADDQGKKNNKKKTHHFTEAQIHTIKMCWYHSLF